MKITHLITSLVYLLIISSYIFCQTDNKDDMIEIETKDGNIFLGNLIEETEKYYEIKTKSEVVHKDDMVEI